MINFYRKTSVLWKITRILLIPLLVASLILFYIEQGFSPGSIKGYLLIGLYPVLLSLSLFRKKFAALGSPLLLTTGIFTLLYGLLSILSIIKIYSNFGIPILVFMAFFCLWLLLFGLGDILNSRKVLKARNSEKVGAEC